MGHRAALPVAALLATVLIAPSIPALELTPPGDMFSWQFNRSGSGDDSYYYLDPSAMGEPTRDFLMVLDDDGELVWFRDAGNLNDFRPIPHTGGYAWVDGRVSNPRGIDIRDAGWDRLTYIPGQHPGEPGLAMDGHEFLIEPDGTYWTLWWETRIVDMSDVIPGGLEHVEVEGHVVQHWDASHNVLWDWRSLDHVDALPYTARLDSSSLYKASFEHLHVNSIEPTPDAVYLSSRTMSVVIKIDRSTGAVEWLLGGGPANEFSFSGNVPPEIPLDFNFQHDARILPNGHLTVFDNGIAHFTGTSYAREYVLDESERTAELVWWQMPSPPSLGRITGSHRVLPGGNHLVGWGNRFPETAFSEITADGDRVAYLIFDNDPELLVKPGTYRVRKSSQFSPATRPYLSATVSDENLRLACNWFGHENQVGSYDVYGGYSPDDLELLGITATGEFFRPAPVFMQPYYFQIVARGHGGGVIGPPSNVLEVQTSEPGLRITPVSSAEIPEEGGVFTYTLTLVNTTPNHYFNVPVFTDVLTPAGTTVGPLLNVQVDILAHTQIVTGNLSQVVPGWAPAGDYEFTAHAGYPNLQFTDTVILSKEGGHGGELLTSRGGWAHGGALPDGFRAPDYAEPAAHGETDTPSPERFHIAPVSPNPFNAQATVRVTLPTSGALRVELVNLLGQRVVTLADAEYASGTHGFTLDASTLASGMYLLRAHVAGTAPQVRKVVVMN